jgi:Ca2+-binding EF-hand superfamily protein
MKFVTNYFAGNGYIPTSCLREILRELDDQLTSDELDMMIEEIDSDGSGTVDFDGKYRNVHSLYARHLS